MPGPQFSTGQWELLAPRIISVGVCRGRSQAHLSPGFAPFTPCPDSPLNQPHPSGHGGSGPFPHPAGSRPQRSHDLSHVTTAPAAGSLPNAWCAAQLLSSARPVPALGAVPPALAPAQASVLVCPRPPISFRSRCVAQGLGFRSSQGTLPW